MTALQAWKTPSDYGGYDPEGHLGVVGVNRDSDALSRSNWEVACQRMAKAAGLEAVPDLADIDSHSWSFDPVKAPPVYQWQAGHWAVGWVRYLMVRPDAPQAVLDEAQAISDAIEDYPILDEQHYSDLEHEEVVDYWQRESPRYRVKLIQEANERGADVSLFAARREELPDDEDGTLYDLLREYVR